MKKSLFLIVLFVSYSIAAKLDNSCKDLLVGLVTNNSCNGCSLRGLNANTKIKDICDTSSFHFDSDVYSVNSTVHEVIQSNIKKGKPLKLLGKADLYNTVFDDMDLSGSDFTEALLVNASFKNAKLNKVNFTSADLSNTDLSGANVNYATFDNASMFGTNIDNASFRYASLNNVGLGFKRLHGNDFSYSTISVNNNIEEVKEAFKKLLSVGDKDTTFFGTSMPRMDLSNITTPYFNATCADLSNTDFTNSIIKNASFGTSSGAERSYCFGAPGVKRKTTLLKGAKFNNTHLFGSVDAWHGDFSGANFTGAQFGALTKDGSYYAAGYAGSNGCAALNMAGSSFVGATIKNTHIFCGNFEGANFSNADFSGSWIYEYNNFNSASFSGSKWPSTSLHTASKFSGATGMEDVLKYWGPCKGNRQGLVRLCRKQNIPDACVRHCELGKTAFKSYYGVCPNQAFNGGPITSCRGIAYNSTKWPPSKYAPMWWDATGYISGDANYYSKDCFTEGMETQCNTGYYVEASNDYGDDQASTRGGSTPPSDGFYGPVGYGSDPRGLSCGPVTLSCQ